MKCSICGHFILHKKRYKSYHWMGRHPFKTYIIPFQKVNNVHFCTLFKLKGIVHSKMKILSSFTHPQVVPNLFECLCSAEHKGRYSEECGKQSSSGAPLTSIVFFFPTMEVNGAPKQPGYKLSLKYLPLCSAEQRHSYRFGTTWGWVNDDTIFIFEWTIPLKGNALGWWYTGQLFEQCFRATLGNIGVNGQPGET